MSDKTVGKNQSYSREINNKLVISNLQKEELSATELAKRLKLSNATMSSILKDLLDEGLIIVAKTESVKGCGRKQVLYTINENYGLVMGINISNYQETITISNTKEEILAKDILGIEKYDSATMYLILLRSAKILMEERFRTIPLRNIIVSLPGRVNNKTGDLMLSKQFDPELFKEQDFITNMFKKQYPNVPIHIVNDINLSATAELRKGCLVDEDNALYISVDMGIGGSVIANGKLFEGDQGYAGELGLIRVYDEDRVDYLDEFVSFRALINKAESILRENLEGSRTRLIELFKENEEIKKLVLHSAELIGNALSNMVEVFDISRIVIGGRAVEFGDEYLDTIKHSMENLMYTPNVSFSSLGRNAKIIGAATLGNDWVLKQSAKKTVSNSNE